MFLDSLKCISCCRDTEDPLLWFVRDDAGNRQYLFWFKWRQPVEEAVCNLVADHRVYGNISNDCSDIVFPINPYRVIGNTLVHHCKRREKLGGHRADQLKFELFDHILESNGAYQAAARKSYQDSSVITRKWF